MASSHHHIETRRMQVISALRESDKPLGPTELATVIGTSPTTISHELRDLLTTGEIVRVGHGKYEVARHADLEPGGHEARVMTYPYLEGGPGAGGAGVQWDGGRRITVPTDVAASWAGGRRVEAESAYWTRVQGSSMEPWLPDGSPIFVERTSEVGSGGRYVLWLDDVDAEIVKRIERFGGGYLRIISDNPAHASQTLRHIADDMFEDQATGATVRVRIRGRVLYPADTPFAILQTVTVHVARMMDRNDIQKHE